MLDSDFIKEAKRKLFDYLDGIGINEEGNIIVARIRKSRGDDVGYYSSMSQFKNKARFVLDIKNIRNGLLKNSGSAPLDWMIIEESCKTLAHEYAHMIAELIKVQVRREEPLDVPDWVSEFFDEEEFAEDFACMVVECQSNHESFWEEFIPKYVSEFNKKFIDENIGVASPS